MYLDYHATTPTDPRVAEVALRHMLESFGNASSVDHTFGDEAELAVELARAQVAELFGAAPRDVVFTSGATESINLAIKGFVSVHARRSRPVRIGLTPLEHPAVLHTCRSLSERRDAVLTYLPVDMQGRLELDSFEKFCAHGLDLVCVMGANNEVGTIYPIEKLTEVAHEHGAIFFTDATQAAGRTDLQFEKWQIDLLAMSGHKIHAPKGIGALLVADGIPLHPVLHGGAQQRGLRPGTANVPGIAALGEACHLRTVEMRGDEDRIARQRDRLESLLLARFPWMVVNGARSQRLAGNLNVSFPGVPNQAIVSRVRSQLAISTGSACSSGIEAPSHVLRAMGLPKSVLESSIRLGLGKFTTDAEVDLAASIVSEAVESILSVAAEGEWHVRASTTGT